MIYDYKRGVYEDLTLQKLSLQADGSYQSMIVDGEVYKNIFTALVLYTDAAGASPIPGGVGGGNYEYANPDTLTTAQEALTGGTGNTVYAQFRVTNATYQGIDLWADFRNFGTYTSNAADYDIVGGSETVNSTVTLTIPQGKTRYRFNFDSSLGDIAPIMPNGSFDGQQVILKDTGEANMTRIKGPGFYLGADSGGMYLKSRSILVTWNADDSVWEMDDCVTADWVSSGQVITQMSNGDMDNEYFIHSVGNDTTVINLGNVSHVVPFSSLSSFSTSEIVRKAGADSANIGDYDTLVTASSTLAFNSAVTYGPKLTERNTIDFRGVASWGSSSAFGASSKMRGKY